MLTYMRKNAGSWIIKILFAIIVIVFVFFYGFSDVKEPQDAVLASVGKRDITVGEYSKAYKNMLQAYSAMYQNRLPEEMIEKMGLKQNVLENLIHRELLLQEADRRAVRVAPREIQQAILETPAFQENGVFSERLYQRVLSHYGMSAPDFERETEQELKIKVFEDLIKKAVKVSDREVQDFFLMQNEQVTLEYAVFDPETIQQTISVSDEEAQAYFEQAKENFREPKRVQVQYLVFEEQVFQDRVEVSPEELEAYYHEDTEQFFEPQKIKARHILFKLEQDAPADEVALTETKARSVLAQLDEGADFEALARKFSEDDGTKDNGGDLGYFKRGDMVRAFEDAAFALQPGETSALVRSPYGFHIIRAEDNRPARTKPFEEVRESLEEELRRDKIKTMVQQEARRAYSRLFKSRDLEGYAQTQGMKIFSTEMFAYGEGPGDMPGNELFSKEAFALEPGELAPAFSIKEKYYLLKLADQKESHIPDLAAVRSAVDRDILRQKRLEAARNLAQETLRQLHEGLLVWENVTLMDGVSNQTVSFSRQNDLIPELGKAPALKEAAFAMESAESFGPEPYQTNKGWVVFRFLRKGLPDGVTVDAQRETIARAIIDRKQQEVFDRFLQELKKTYQTTVNTKLFAGV